MSVSDSFIKLAQNKDISDEDLFDELCYIHAKNDRDFHMSHTRMENGSLIGINGIPVFDRKASLETVKTIRDRNPTLDTTNGFDVDRKVIQKQIDFASQMDPFHQTIEKYEMKKRIQSLEQTLKTFMEQTRKEHLAQEATIQSLSKEMDEFQEEFYDCQSDLKEHVGLLEDALQEAVENVLELHHLRDHLKYKMS